MQCLMQFNLLILVHREIVIPKSAKLQTYKKPDHKHAVHLERSTISDGVVHMTNRMTWPRIQSSYQVKCPLERLLETKSKVKRPCQSLSPYRRTTNRWLFQTSLLAGQYVCNPEWPKTVITIFHQHVAS